MQCSIMIFFLLKNVPIQYGNIAMKWKVTAFRNPYNDFQGPLSQGKVIYYEMLQELLSISPAESWITFILQNS